MRSIQHAALAAALGFSAIGRAQSNLVEMLSPPGDYIGAGQTYATTNATDFTMTGTPQYIVVTFAGFWIEFDGPGSQSLQVGAYTNAARYPFNGEQPGLTVSGNGRGCNTVCGEFEILEVHTGLDGQVDRFWCTFSHSCECFMAAMTGEVRYHSALAPATPPPRTLHVPADFASIQSAIDAAHVFGDTIVVAPGTYPEALSFRGKRLVVLSEQGPAATALMPPASAAAVAFTGGEPREAELRGFTLVGGAGGIYVGSASPTLTGNVITNAGYGINVQFASLDSHPLIRG